MIVSKVDVLVVKGRRLLVPWYRYPPFTEERIGGLSVAVWEITRELGRRGVRVDVLTPESSADLDGERYGVRVVASRLGEKFYKNQALDKEEGRALEDYDAVLSVANYGAGTLQSCRRVVSTILRQLHVAPNRPLSSYVSLKPDLFEYLRMSLAKERDRANLRRLKGLKTICVSEYIRVGMQSSGLEDSHNLVLIPNGIQTETFRPMSEVKRYDLLFIGRFQRSKGLDILLRALSLNATGKDEVYKLAVVGPISNEERQYLLGRVPGATKDAIVFLGSVHRDTLPTVINQSKLVVVPSRYESFGLPALEAIACGVPVLASRVGGLPEIIDESVGVLVEPNNAHALAKAIRITLRSQDMREKAATVGPAKASRYDWDLVAAELQRAILT